MAAHVHVQRRGSFVWPSHAVYTIYSCTCVSMIVCFIAGAISIKIAPSRTGLCGRITQS